MTSTLEVFIVYYTLLPKWGLGLPYPQAKPKQSELVHVSLKIRPLVATIVMIFQLTKIYSVDIEAEVILQ